jgi:hypothetical protein
VYSNLAASMMVIDINQPTLDGRYNYNRLESELFCLAAVPDEHSHRVTGWVQGCTLEGQLAIAA